MDDPIIWADDKEPHTRQRMSIPPPEDDSWIEMEEVDDTPSWTLIAALPLLGLMVVVIVLVATRG